MLLCDLVFFFYQPQKECFPSAPWLLGAAILSWVGTGTAIIGVLDLVGELPHHPSVCNAAGLLLVARLCSGVLEHTHTGH